ncbi:MAG: ferritin-like domain-containing protein [Alphaproteobacteria bacterium]|nr:ferritin-like domain-containing protein [Alphaproteobacteria bacterium]
MSQKWKFEDINWSLFDPQKVNPELLQLIKAGSVIEHNGPDYGLYLRGVFADDPLFDKEIDGWVRDEIKHGKVLARWVELVDPTYDFEDRFKAYVEGFSIDTEATESIRGSCAAELLTRCMIEIGTSTFYTSIKDATDEPLLKQICQKIAADELRHYKLFYTHLQRHQAKERLSFLKRFTITFNRLLGSQDDELPFAYYISNSETRPYTRHHYTKVYGKIMYGLFRKDHIDRAMGLFCKAIGANPQGWFHKTLSFAVFKMLSSKAKAYAKAVVS